MQNLKINEAERIIDILLLHFKVDTYSELATILGVTQGNISAWKKRNSTNGIKKKLKELGVLEKILSEFEKDNKLNLNQKNKKNSGNTAGVNYGNMGSSNNITIDADILRLMESINPIIRDDRRKKEELEKILKDWLLEKLKI